jgi:hypothetical protein
MPWLTSVIPATGVSLRPARAKKLTRLYLKEMGVVVHTPCRFAIQERGSQVQSASSLSDVLVGTWLIRLAFECVGWITSL